jgi:hypothetical protein
VRAIPVLLLSVVVSLAACDGSGTTGPQGPPPPQQIQVDGGVRHQTIDGWATHLRMWEEDKANDRYDATIEPYAAQVYQFLVDSVGINAVRLEIPSGMENPNNRWKEFREGRLSYSAWQKTRFEKINDNGDPNAVNPSGFTFDNLDFRVEYMLAPLRKALEARGEKLHVNVNYTDFQWDASIVQGSLSHANAPAEFAEFVLASFVRLRDRYGIVPDAFEVILEPDNTASWRGANIGRGLIAATDRLRASGFTPEVIAPSNSTMGGAISYFDEMMAVPGVASRVRSFAYHRYGTERSSDVATIRARAQAAGLKTAMLEKVDAGIDVLLEDLTVGNVSAWQQWAAASSTKTEDNGGYYARVDLSNPTKPVGMAKHSAQLAQVFRFVRRGAVRVGATSASDRQSVAFINPDGRYVVVVRTHGAVGEFGVVGLPAGRYAQRFVSDDRRTESTAPVEIPANGFLSANVQQAGVLTIYGVP